MADPRLPRSAAGDRSPWLIAAAGAVTTVSPYNAKACARFSTGKVSAKIDCSVGARPPPPMPCSTRAISIIDSDEDTAHSSDAAVNSATHPM
jgi:hypothetical protein